MHVSVSGRWALPPSALRTPVPASRLGLCLVHTFAFQPLSAACCAGTFLTLMCQRLLDENLYQPPVQLDTYFRGASPCSRGPRTWTADSGQQTMDSGQRTEETEQETRPGQDWTGQNNTEQFRSGQDKTEQNMARQDRTSQDSFNI